MKRTTLVAGAVLAAAQIALPAIAEAVSFVDLADYRLVGRYQLPEPTRTALPLGTAAHNLLAQEASAVTWRRDTNTLFILGDGGTAIVQVGLTGSFIDTMSLALGGSPQGTAFYDPEGLTYVGGGQFVMVEERYRIANRFTYVPGTTLGLAGAQRVTLGTTIGNVGIEGLTYDPLTSGATPGFVMVKEISPQGIFQTNIDFSAGTATNGSPTTVNSVNLFNPALAGLADFADVFALSNIAGIGGGDQSHLLILSQDSGRIVEVDRNGTIFSSLSIPFLPASPLGTTVLTGAGGPVSVLNQQHEGLTMDDAGNLYVVSENGGGDVNNPQLWVFAPVPEADPVTMMLAGLGLVGWLARRRSSGKANVATR